MAYLMILLGKDSLGMKKLTLLLTMMLLSSAAWAYDSGIALTTDQGTEMQVYINGKLYNKKAG